MSQSFCTQCNNPIESSDNFCPKCGGVVRKPDEQNSASTSGSGVTAKRGSAKKIFRNIIIGLVISGIIALLIWFNVDPKAGEKLTKVLVGLLVIAIFIFLIYRSAKKGKKSRSHSSSSGNYNNYTDDRYNDDYDDSGDDSGDD